MTEAPHELLQRAAVRIRQRAITEHTVRDGDPYYYVETLPDGTEVTEQSAWERVVTPDVGLAVAEWLETEARNARIMQANALPHHAEAVARALLSA